MADTDEMADTEEAAGATIVDVATEAGTFTTLIAAVDAAGLTETLMGEGPFTVLAPTDEAFAALPEGTVESLLEDPEGALTDVLSLHVISGTEATSTDVVAIGDGGTLDTLGGARHRATSTATRCPSAPGTPPSSPPTSKPTTASST